MARPAKVLAFRVSLNGRSAVTAGIPGPHVVSVILSSVVRESGAFRGGRPMPERELGLHIGGLITSTREHVDWQDVDLKVGDKVTIEVVQVPEADEPKHRHPPRRDPNEPALNTAGKPPSISAPAKKSNRSPSRKK
jgi:hypothetical protein